MDRGSVVPEDADALADAATAATPLRKSGLTPRALSALEQLRAETVGQLAWVDPVVLNHYPGLTGSTRTEVRARAKAWRAKFRRKGGPWLPVDDSTPLDAPHDNADVLIAAARVEHNDRAVVLASHLLGVTGTLGANATQAELAASLQPPVTSGRVSQLLAALQDRWAADEWARVLLDRLSGVVDERLIELGGVATFDELADHLLTLMVPASKPDDSTDRRLVEGLLRCSIDRRAALQRAEDPSGHEDGGWFLRRRSGRPVLVATRSDLLDVAESLGRRADALVAETNGSGTDALVPAARATEQLDAVLAEASRGISVDPYEGLRAGRRLVRLAASLAAQARASAVDELHSRDLSPAEALRLALPAVAPGQSYQPDDLRARVQHRFPQLTKLPERPELDALVAPLGLRWDEEGRTYRTAPVPGGDTTGLDSRPATRVATTVPVIGPGAVGQRLADSLRSRSFVAFGVGALWLDKFRAVLRDGFDAVELDLTGALMDALRATAESSNVPWEAMVAADNATPGSRDYQGLRAVVRRSLPVLRQTIASTLDAAAAEGRPVLLLDASLLARYDALGELTPWLDLTTKRPTALWLAVPQLYSNVGATVDGHPLQLTAPSQYVPVSEDWIQTYRAVKEGAPA